MEESKFENGLTQVIADTVNQGCAPTISQVGTVFANMRFYLISNMRQPLTQAYVEIGVVKTVVDVPVDDGLRGGVEIKSKELSPEELEELHFTMEQEDDVTVMGEALKWNRLYGGAGVLIITEQDPAKPLDLSKIKKDQKLEFRAVDMWELFWDKQNTGEYIPELQADDFTHYSYYGHKVHRSRVLLFKGQKVPSFLRPRLRGWGTSIVEILIRSINQYLKATDLTFQVLDEFKVDIYKIKNLNSSVMSPAGEEKIKRRINLANFQKNFQNAITMDSEDDFSQKELSFAGISETMLGIRMQIASDLRMPMSKVFGISAQGFGSGEDDIENYNAMVESTIRRPAKKHFITMAKVRCMQLFGYIPDDLRAEYKPLRMLTSEQEENVKTQKLNRLIQARDKGEMTSKEFKDACNKDNLLGVQLDTTVDSLDLKVEEAEALAEVQTSQQKEIAKTAPKAKKGATDAPKAKE